MRRGITLLLTLVFLLSTLPLTVSANAPGPSEVGGSGEVQPVVILIFLLISAMGIVLTVVVEWFVSKPFGIGKEYRTLIFLTNIVTQIVLRFLQLFTFPLMPDGMSAVVWTLIYLTALEAIVYISEFLIYNWRMQTISWKKCLLYTIVANTASLLAGLLLLFIIL